MTAYPAVALALGAICNFSLIGASPAGRGREDGRAAEGQEAVDSHDTLIAPVRGDGPAAPVARRAHVPPPAETPPDARAEDAWAFGAPPLAGQGAPLAGQGAPVLGRYCLLERLGAGGFGTVWRAHDQLLDREVAVKAIPLPAGEDRERAAREALATARLAHPAIVALYEACAQEDTFYLISELVHGDTLARLIADDALADEEILEVGLALAEALAHAHSRGVVHRDIKPHNVLVPAGDPVGDPAAKLTDFGGALLAGEEALTRTGDVLGTLAYMAPEQIDGGEVDEAADLYSLALVLYEAFTGLNPVRGATPAATARRIGERLPPLGRNRRDLPRGLTQALDRALDPEPGSRGTLPELSDALAWTRQHGLGRAPRARRTAARGRAPVREEAPAPEQTAAREETPARQEAAAPGGWLTRQRLVWLTAMSGLCVWQATSGRPAIALAVLCAVLPLVALVRRPGAQWIAAALAPALGAAGLAAAFPALAGQLSRWRARALLGALGCWWLQLAQPLIAGHSGTAELTARLASVSVPAAVALWAATATVLPWVVRGRSAMLDAFAAIVWASASIAATLLVRRDLPAAHAALPSPHAVILGAVLGVAVAVVARALRGPVPTNP